MIAFDHGFPFGSEAFLTGGAGYICAHALPRSVGWEIRWNRLFFLLSPRGCEMALVVVSW